MAAKKKQQQPARVYDFIEARASKTWGDLAEAAARFVSDGSIDDAIRHEDTSVRDAMQLVFFTLRVFDRRLRNPSAVDRETLRKMVALIGPAGDSEKGRAYWRGVNIIDSYAPRILATRGEQQMGIAFEAMRELAFGVAPEMMKAAWPISATIAIFAKYDAASKGKRGKLSAAAILATFAREAEVLGHTKKATVEGIRKSIENAVKLHVRR